MVILSVNSSLSVKATKFKNRLTKDGRNVLDYIHIRKGPNKVGFVGIFQPFRDVIKSFSREQYFLLVSNYLIYYFSPIFGFFLIY
jgi:NADH:ubiquinone oxidoreductase subunit H